MNARWRYNFRTSWWLTWCLNPRKGWVRVGRFILRWEIA